MARPRSPGLRLALALAALASSACGSSAIGSVGALLVRDNHTGALYVRDVPSGLAAEKAGLRAGDEVLMIDGVYVGQLEPKDLRAKLRGEVGAATELTIVRGGSVIRTKVVRTPLREAAPKPPKETRLDE